MLLFKVYKKITSHPLNKDAKLKAVMRFLRWQLGSRLLGFSIVYPFTHKSKLLIGRGMAGATNNIYCGLDEFTDMSFLLHFLRAEDVFVDIGANIGSYTVLASAHVGCKSVSVEPGEDSYNKLVTNIKVNNIESLVTPLNLGLGSKKGVLRFTKSSDTINHIALENETDTVDIPIDTLDHIMADKSPSLLKIDVEGFEKEVLIGGLQTLENVSLRAIIIEVVGHANRYGYSNTEIDSLLRSKGFLPFAYEPFKRALVPVDSFSSQNTIYIKNLAFVLDRIRHADKIKIFHFEY